MSPFFKKRDERARDVVRKISELLKEAEKGSEISNVQRRRELQNRTEKSGIQAEAFRVENESAERSR